MLEGIERRLLAVEQQQQQQQSRVQPPPLPAGNQPPLPPGPHPDEDVRRQQRQQHPPEVELGDRGGGVEQARGEERNSFDGDDDSFYGGECAADGGPLDRLFELLPRAQRVSRDALPPLAPAEMPVFYQVMADLKQSARMSIDERHKWEFVAARTPSDLKFSERFLKDLLQVINTLDAASEAVLELSSSSSPQESAKLMSWVLFMSNRYLRSYIGEFIRREAATAWAHAGQPMKALADLQARERDPKRPISEAEADREARRILQMAKANFYAANSAVEKRNNQRGNGKRANSGKNASNAGGRYHGASSSSRGGHTSMMQSHHASGSGAATSSTGSQN
jgi:hypothetical protein